MPLMQETQITTQTHRLAARVGGVTVSVVVVQSEDGDPELAAEMFSGAVNSVCAVLDADEIVPNTWIDSTDTHTEVRREQRHRAFAISEPYIAAFAASNPDPEEWSHVA